MEDFYMFLGEEKRSDYIDWSKAIFLVLIVLGNMMPTSSWPKTLAHAIHIPLFAVIGGAMLIAPKTWREFGRRCFDLFKYFVAPYIVWFVISCSFYWKSEETMPEQVKGLATTDFVEILKQFVFFENQSSWNQALWFIPCLIVLAYVFIAFTALTRGNRIASLCLSVASFTAAIVLEKNEITFDIGEVKNVFGLKNYLVLLGFIALGYTLRFLFDFCLELTEKKWKNPVLYASAAVCVALCVICLKSNAVEISKNAPGGYFGISLYSGNYNDMLLFVLFAAAISVSLMIAVMLLPRCETVQLLSKNTMLILSAHFFFFFDDTFRTVTTSKKGIWAPMLKKIEYEAWEIDMIYAYRDTAFIILVFVGIAWAFNALFKKHPKLRHVFAFVGIQ